jgi:two-component system, OmpR family, phosphate regulon sensor histidine kinase PhoR
MSRYSPLLPADREQLGEVVNRLPTGVILISSFKHQIVYVNAAARRALHPVRLSRGAPVPDVWPEFSLPEYATRLFESGVAPARQVSVGHDQTYLIKGIPPRSSNIAVLLLDDVSELERRRRVEREFISNAAHELITPLTGLVGAAHVLESGAKEIPEDRDRFIGHIGAEAARLTGIARALLTLARAQSGEEPPRLEVLSVGRSLQDAVDAVGDGKADRFEIKCAPELTVLADPDLLARALENLLANALRHGSGKPLNVEAAEFGLKQVAIQLVDSGALDHVDVGTTEPRRFHSGAGRDSGGFGLGLAIASQSLEVMGGKLIRGGESMPGILARVELPSGRVTAL